MVQPSFLDNFRASPQLIDTSRDAFRKERCDRNGDNQRDHGRQDNVDIRPAAGARFDFSLCFVDRRNEAERPANPDRSDNLVFIVAQRFVKAHLIIVLDVR